jgi:4-hydroxybenzoyl-CoA reductase subunit alpha
MSLYLMCSMLALPYRLPHLRVDGYLVYTNTPPSGAMRGHGVPQSRFAADVQMDLAAREMGLDPLEVRLNNALKAGEITPNGLKITSCGLEESIRESKKIVERWRREKTAVGDSKTRRGLGVACFGFISGPRMAGHNSSASIVKVHEDGKISLNTGSTDAGQGSDTIFSQIAAEVLGVHLEDVRYVMLDSDITPVDPGTYGSRLTFITGNAVRVAAEDARRQLAEVAAEALDTDAGNLVFRDRKVYVSAHPERSLAFDKLVKMAQYSGEGKTILGRGYWAPEGLEVADFATGRGNMSGAYSFGTQVAEVEVDTATGRVKVTRMAMVHDCGQPINLTLVEGQVEGSSITAISHALAEEIIREDGQVMNASFLEYRMATSLDACDVETLHTDTYDGQGPFGAKECGEGIQISAGPAIVNAISDALGVPFKRMPVTPDTVLKALRQHQEEE